MLFRSEKRRLADVGIAGQRDGRRLGALTLLASNVTLLAEVLQPPAEKRDPAACDAPVCLELRFAGPSCPDARSEGAHAAPEAL